MKLTKVNSSVYVTIKAPHSDLEAIKKAILDYVREQGDQKVNLGQLSQWTSSAPSVQCQELRYTNFIKFVGDIEGLCQEQRQNGRIKHILLQKMSFSVNPRCKSDTV